MRLHSPIPQPCWCLAPVLPKQNGLPHNDWNATAHVILRQMARQRRRARLVQFDRRHSSALKQHSAGSLPLSSFRESHKASETTHMASEATSWAAHWVVWPLGNLKRAVCHHARSRLLGAERANCCRRNGTSRQGQPMALVWFDVWTGHSSSKPDLFQSCTSGLHHLLLHVSWLCA